MTHATLAVNQQGTLEPLLYPQYKEEGTSRWVILQCAVFKFYTDGGYNGWFDDDPYFLTNLTHALRLPPCDRSELGERIIREIQILETLSKLI